VNHQETSKLLAVMNTVWKDQTDADPDQQTIAYQMALEDVSYQDASEAIKRCLRELVFFPKPAEIIERLPQPAIPRAITEGAKRGPRSAYDCGYLDRPATGPNARPMTPHEPRSWDLPGVPTLAEIVARETKTPPEPVSLPAVVLSGRSR
jgi:hypothetical protein